MYIPNVGNVVLYLDLSVQHALLKKGKKIGFEKIVVALLKSTVEYKI